MSSTSSLQWFVMPRTGDPQLGMLLNTDGVTSIVIVPHGENESA